jgi:hypothetical protein
MMSKVQVVSSIVEPRLRRMLVAREPITRGATIFTCAPEEIVRERTFRTIQIDGNRHLRNEYLDYVDHSCEPNSVFDTERLSLVALRDIAAHEAITFFYPGSEVDLATDFPCACRAAECLGHIRGAFYLTPAQMRWALERGYCTPFMAENLRRLLGLAARP